MDWSKDETLLTQLNKHEGFRSKPYKDTVGKLTIGVGRNLDDRGITFDEAQYLLKRDIILCVGELDVHVPWWKTISPNRQRVLIDMCFNLGIHGLTGFVETLALIRKGYYESAAEEMLDSRWARQVGIRASILAKMMREG